MVLWQMERRASLCNGCASVFLSGSSSMSILEAEGIYRLTVRSIERWLLVSREKSRKLLSSLDLFASVLLAVVGYGRTLPAFLAVVVDFLVRLCLAGGWDF